MDSIHINGRQIMHGTLKVQGSKNAALPVLAACLLIDGVCRIENCPDITDVHYMIKLLESIGCKVVYQNEVLVVDASTIIHLRLPSEFVTVMRSSVILMGALLARGSEAQLDYPGGCVIGKRPIDIHLEGLKQLGAQIVEKEESIDAKTDGMVGRVVTFPFPSVGATENLILAATNAEGVTHIVNYAKEPEIETLCRFINAAGGKIENFGNDVLIITGKQKLHETSFRIPSDRIVAGTYLLACQATKGEIYLDEAPIHDLEALFPYLEQMGSRVVYGDHGIWMQSKERTKPIPHIETKVFPGFPTDLQSQMMVALAMADGESVIQESIFENRFKVAKELNAMGAKVKTERNKAYISGCNVLYGKQVVAEELRGGAALVVAGLCAEGVTVVTNKHFIDRGYVDICRDFERLGVQISSD